MDVLFIDLPLDSPIASPTWSLGYRSMIANLRENGFTSTILHPLPIEKREAQQQIIRDVLNIEPKIIGFTTYDIYLLPVIQFVKEMREAGVSAHVTLGGLCASAIPHEILSFTPDVDSIIIGEGELSVVDLSKMIVRGAPDVPKGVFMQRDGGIISGGVRPLIENLDDLPSPAMDNFTTGGRNNISADYQIDSMLFIASRGCYGRCTFCCIQRFNRSCPGRSWRARSPQKVVKEISLCRQITGLNKYTFVDENFLGPGQIGIEHAREIAEELQKEQLILPFNFGCRPNDLHKETLIELKKVGLTAVTLGIESMSDETLRLFNKGTTAKLNEEAIRLLEELNIFLEMTFIFFHPLITLQEVMENTRFVERVRRSKFAYFNRNMPFTEFVPFFGTEYTQRLQEMKLVERTINGFNVRYVDPRVETIVVKIRTMQLEKLCDLNHQLWTEDQHLGEVHRSLLKYEAHLNLVRLPSLVSEYCELCTSGRSDEKVEAVLQEFDREAVTVQRLLDLALTAG